MCGCIKYEFYHNYYNTIPTVRINNPFQWLPIVTSKAHNDTIFHAKFRRTDDQSLSTVTLFVVETTSVFRFIQRNVSSRRN